MMSTPPSSSLSPSGTPSPSPLPISDVLDEMGAWLVMHSFSEKTFVWRAREEIVRLRKEKQWLYGCWDKEIEETKRLQEENRLLNEEAEANSRLADCLHCGEEIGKDEAAGAAHLASCPTHPMRNLEESLRNEQLQRAAAENELDRLRGLILRFYEADDCYDIDQEAERLLAEQGKGSGVQAQIRRNRRASVENECDQLREDKKHLQEALAAVDSRIEKRNQEMVKLQKYLDEYGGRRCTAVCPPKLAGGHGETAHWCLLPQGHGGPHVHLCMIREAEVNATLPGASLKGRSNGSL